MATSLKHKLLNMFREILLYHSDSLAFRAKILTLYVLGDDGEISDCEMEKLRAIARAIYPEDHDRAEILLEVVREYYDKISENNNLAYDNLIRSIEEDIRRNPRFVHKIDLDLYADLKTCLATEEDRIFHDRIGTFLKNLKDEYGKL
jgi:uncharacterized tellurite resistance protein B-like protein